MLVPSDHIFDAIVHILFVILSTRNENDLHFSKFYPKWSRTRMAKSHVFKSWFW